MVPSYIDAQIGEEMSFVPPLFYAITAALTARLIFQAERVSSRHPRYLGYLFGGTCGFATSWMILAVAFPVPLPITGVGGFIRIVGGAVGAFLPLYLGASIGSRARHRTRAST